MDALFQLNNEYANVERNVKHLLLRKTDALKTSIFSARKFEEIH